MYRTLILSVFVMPIILSEVILSAEKYENDKDTKMSLIASEQFQTLGHLNAIDLSHKKINAKNVAKIVELLCESNAEAEELYLRHNALDPEAIKELFAVLPKTKIKKLDLSVNKIGDGGVQHIKLLETNIEELSLKANNISIVGIKTLNLQGSKLKFINICDNETTNDFLYELGRLLQENSIQGNNGITVYFTPGNIREEVVGHLHADYPIVNWKPIT